MSDARPRVLVIGYGNPGRLDDGLGPAFASAVERAELEGVSVDADYQLTVEDAAAAAEHDVVIFADAAVSGPEPLFFERIEPANQVTFSTHSVQPPSVLGLVRDMFESDTVGYALGIRGYEFNEFGERLSERAASNLARALEIFLPLIAERRFDQAERSFARTPAHESHDAGEDA